MQLATYLWALYIIKCIVIGRHACYNLVHVFAVVCFADYQIQTITFSILVSINHYPICNLVTLDLLSLYKFLCERLSYVAYVWLNWNINICTYFHLQLLIIIIFWPKNIKKQFNCLEHISILYCYCNSSQYILIHMKYLLLNNIKRSIWHSQKLPLPKQIFAIMKEFNYIDKW